MTTVTHYAMYEDRSDAALTVADLVDAGISRDTISVLANRLGNKDTGELDEGDLLDNNMEAGLSPGESAAFGALSGAAVGLVTLFIPGIGPALAAGTAAAALGSASTGAVAGAGTGAIVSMLQGLDMTSDQIAMYQEGLRRGGVLVMVTCNAQDEPLVMDILTRHHPVDLDERVAHYREHEGWTGFDPDAEPLTYDEIQADRRRWR